MTNLTTVAAATVDDSSGIATVVVTADQVGGLAEQNQRPVWGTSAWPSAAPLLSPPRSCHHYPAIPPALPIIGCLLPAHLSTPLQAVRHRPLSEVWLSVPSMSRWQWHPFSVASGGGSSLKLHVKAYGRYTQVGCKGPFRHSDNPRASTRGAAEGRGHLRRRLRQGSFNTCATAPRLMHAAPDPLQRLLDALRHRQPLAVRLSGPMGNEMSGSCLLAPPPAWQRYETCIMFGGGVGVTALLSMLRCIAGVRSAGKQAAAPLPRRVLCVWTARRMAEFSVLDAPLLRAAG